MYPFLDCFGVVNEIRHDLGMEKLPDFAGVTKDNNGLDREARNYIKKLTSCSPENGALALCYSGSIVTHVAIVIDANEGIIVAESNPKTNVTFISLSRFIKRFVRVEFYK